MKAFVIVQLVLGAHLFSQSVLAESELNSVLAWYQSQSDTTVSVERGERLWLKQGIVNNGKTRQCSSCHGNNLTKTGKHLKTGKQIEPMALTVNSQRYSKRKKIEKWFKRNCKWTFGRECTIQEKADILLYLSKT